MKVVLAGYNVDSRVLDRLGRGQQEAVTPEVLSASYARVSRDPRNIGTLRKEALHDLEKARRSNERIVFGLGHASVAEHAVLNFDITGISRLAVESLEHFRLASFTEKSQRYCHLDRDFVIPREVSCLGLEEKFGAIVSCLHDAYKKILLKMEASRIDTSSAKEDARYVMPLAAATQLGMTVNARELEYMIMRLGAHPLSELRELSRLFYRRAHRTIPSLIRYPEPTAHWKDTAEARNSIVRQIDNARSRSRPGRKADLIYVTRDADRWLASVMIFASTNVSMNDADRIAQSMSKDALERVIAASMRKLGIHDAVWREFECVEFIFELRLSASCFAQLKRHRMATIIAQPYDISLGVSIPSSVKKAKAVSTFRAAIGRVERFYERYVDLLGGASEYVLTNAHCRRVLFACNLRELYHFSRLRSDSTAQWEIRALSDEMCSLASKAVPFATRLLAGKDSFERAKERLDLGHSEPE